MLRKLYLWVWSGVWLIHAPIWLGSDGLKAVVISGQLRAQVVHLVLLLPCVLDVPECLTEGEYLVSYLLLHERELVL